jgi:hypothetical protein
MVRLGGLAVSAGSLMPGWSRRLELVTGSQQVTGFQVMRLDPQAGSCHLGVSRSAAHRYRALRLLCRRRARCGDCERQQLQHRPLRPAAQAGSHRRRGWCAGLACACGGSGPLGSLVT